MEGASAGDASSPERPVVPRSIFRAARSTSDTFAARAAVPAKWIVLPYFRARRRRLTGTRVVCVTGSIGKTTTAYLLAAIAGPLPTGRVGRNRARGTIRGVRRAPGSPFLVQEVGASGPATLDELLWVLEPDVSIVTAVASDHLSAFRTLDAVAHEKAKAVAMLPPDGVAIVNADDPRVLAMRELCAGRVVTFGESARADLRITDVCGGYPGGVAFRAHMGGVALPVQTQLLGRHLAGCAAAALAAAVALGHELRDAVARLAAIPPAPHRLSPFRPTGGPTFLLDDRKASIATVAPAFAALADADHAGRKVVVLGDVSDTRRGKRQLYRGLAMDARAVADLVVLVGRWAHHGLRARADDDDRSILAFASVPETADFLRSELRPDDLVLVKGSHQYEHLARIALQFERPVRCRRLDCRRHIDCESCKLLERSSARRPAWTGALDIRLRSGRIGYGGR